MATADLTVLALGRPGAGASEYIAEIQKRLRRQDRVRYRMHAMGTSLEGSTEDILAVVAELHAVPFEQGVPRVYTVLKLDERRDRPAQTLDDKIRAVEARLGGDISPGRAASSSSTASRCAAVVKHCGSANSSIAMACSQVMSAAPRSSGFIIAVTCRGSSSIRSHHSSAAGRSSSCACD